MSVESITQGRIRRARRVRVRTGVLVVLGALLFSLALMVGNTFYSPSEVMDVVLGHDVPGASFTVGHLRLPRACLALLAGAAFGIAGVTFQTMLRNPLASPDIIGITAGASAAAVFAILVLSVSETVVSALAIVAGLATALTIYVLAYRDGVAGSRLILIGIGVAAMLDSVVAYLILRAAMWDLPTAMQWLTGSLNGATWSQVTLLLAACLVGGPALLAQGRNLGTMQLGDDTAAALGVPVERTRLVSIVAAVGLIAFATAATGPIAFVAFLSGPIAARIVGGSRSLMVPAALVGAVLVLGADLLGQHAFGTRYPVGVITGVLGAPYLVYLLIRNQRQMEAR